MSDNLNNGKGDSCLDDILKSLENNPLVGRSENLIEKEISSSEEPGVSDLQTLVDGVQEEINPNFNANQNENKGPKKKLHPIVIIGVVILLLIVMFGGTYFVVSKKIAKDKQAVQDKIQAELDAEEKKNKEEKEKPEVTEDKTDFNKIKSSILNKGAMETPKLPEFVAGYRDTLSIPCNIYGVQMSPGFVQYLVEIDYNGNNYLTNIPYEVYVRMKSPNIVTVDIEYYHDSKEEIYITSVTLNDKFMKDVIDAYNRDMKIEAERLKEKEKQEKGSGKVSGSFEGA